MTMQTAVLSGMGLIVLYAATTLVSRSMAGEKSRADENSPYALAR
jgi:hypothetical protein